MGDRGENIGALVWVSYDSMGVGGDMVKKLKIQSEILLDKRALIFLASFQVAWEKPLYILLTGHEIPSHLYSEPCRA